MPRWLSFATIGACLLFSLAGEAAANSTPSRVPQKNDRIVIVGAGPAGIHMSYALTQEGYTDITVLERLNYVGGKVTGGPKGTNMSTIDTGAVLLTVGYRNLLPLIFKLGLGVENSTSRDPPVGMSMKLNQSPKEVVDYEETFFDTVRSYTGDKDADRETMKGRVVQCLQKYTDDWTQIVGPYIDPTSRLPKRIPTQILKGKLQGSAKQYFEEINCPELGAMVAFANTLYGYGSNVRITKFYLFTFLVPQYFGLFLSRCPKEVFGDICDFGVDPSAFVINPFMRIKGGFHGLFRKLADNSVAKFKTGVEIKSIKRNKGAKKHANAKQDAPVVVEFAQRKAGSREEGPVQTQEFDFLIIAADPTNAVAPGGWLDATKEEKRLFAPRDTSTIVGTLFSSESKFYNNVTNNKIPGLHGPTVFFTDVLVDFDNKEQLGHTTALIDFTPFTGGSMDDSTKYTVAYQIYDHYDIDKVAPGFYMGNSQEGQKFRSKARSTLKDQLTPHGFSGVKVHQQNVYSYSPRMFEEQALQGFMWDILDLQGKHDTWYLGSVCAYDTTESVVDYNVRVLKEVGLVKPPTAA